MDTNKAKNYFWVFLDILIAGIILNLILFVMPTIRNFGNSLGVARTVTVSADGKTVATPDIALSSFSVVSRGVNPEVLSATNNKKISSVIDFLKSEGIEGKDIQTTGYNLSPDYRYDPKEERSYITGYTFTQAVSVKMRDFKKIPAILGGLTPLGVNQIGGITFSVEEPEKFLAIARADAIKKAGDEAFQMAELSGARLGRVVSIGEHSSIPVPYYAEAFGRGGGIDVAAQVTPEIEPGMSEIRDQVTVTYELR